MAPQKKPIKKPIDVDDWITVNAGGVDDITDWADVPKPKERTLGQKAISLGLRTVPAVGGSIVGSLLGPGGTVGGGLAGGAFGETLGEWYEGEGFNPALIATEGLLNTIPFIGKVPGVGSGLRELGKFGLKSAAQGGVQGLVGSVPRHIAATGEWELPSLREAAEQTAGGTIFGGATGLGFGTITRRGARPTVPSPDIPSPPSGPSGQMELPLQADLPLSGRWNRPRLPEPAAPVEPTAAELPFGDEFQPSLPFGPYKGPRGRFTSTPPPFEGPGGQYALPFDPSVPYEGAMRGRPFEPLGDRQLPPMEDFAPRPIRPPVEPPVFRPPIEAPIEPAEPLSPELAEVARTRQVTPEQQPGGPEVITIKEPSALYLEQLRQQGFEPWVGHRSLDGYPQWIRKAAIEVAEPEPIQPKQEGQIPFNEDEGFTLPTERITKSIIDNLKKQGYELVKSDEKGGLFKRLLSDETGSLDITEMYDALRAAGRRMREIMPGETRGRVAPFPRSLSDLIHDMRTSIDDTQLAELMDRTERQIMNETDPVVIKRNLDEIIAAERNDGSASFLPRLREAAVEMYEGTSDRPMSPENPQDVAQDEWVSRLEEAESIPPREELQVLPETIHPRMARRIEDVGSTDWDFSPRPPTEQGQLFPMEMRRQSQLERIAGAENIPEQVDLGPDPNQRRLPFEKTAGALTRQQYAEMEKALVGREARRPSKYDAQSWDGWAIEQLNNIEHGTPGLSVKQRYPNMEYSSTEIVYRGPKGNPVAYASVYPEYGNGITNPPTGKAVSTFAADRSKGLLYGRAVKAIGEKLIEMGAAKASGSISNFTDNLIRQLKRLVEGEEGHLDINAMNEGIKDLFNRFMKSDETGAVTLGAGGKKGKEPSILREAYNLPRGATTTADLSAPLRQGLPLITTKHWWKAWVPQVKSLGSEGAFQKSLADLRSRELFQNRLDVETGKVHKSFAEQHGMELMELGNKLGKREEAVASTWIESGAFLGKDLAPVYKATLGRVARASNRAYTAFLNQLRADSFEALLKEAKRDFDSGLEGARDPFTDSAYAKEIADFVNTATGRGPLKIARPTVENGRIKLKESNFEQAAGILTDTIFSPRLMFSRVRMLNPLTYSMASPFVRKQYIKSILSVAGAWGTISGLTYMANKAGIIDASVSLDPNSADFGKIRIGNTRLDPAAGFQQYLVAASKLLSGKTTSSSRGVTSELGQGFRAETRGDVAERFLANKLHPVAKFGWDLMFASKYQPFQVGDRTAQLFVPLIIQDVMELAREDPSLLPLLGPIGMGMGTQTYGKGEAVSKFVPKKKDIVFTGGPFQKIFK